MMQRANPFATVDRPSAPDDMAQRMERVEQLLTQILITMSATAGGSAKGTKLSPIDHAHLAVLLPVIARSVGDAWWTVRDLTEAAEHRPALRTVIEKFEPHALGCLLSRAQGATIEGLRVERDDRMRNGAKRRVVAAR